MREDYETINDVHLYDSLLEAIFKCLGWIASWLGGVFIAYDSEERISACAFLIFSISLLMEFVLKRRIIQQRVLYFFRNLFILLPMIMISLSLSVLFGRPLFEKISTANFFISFLVLVYIICDTLSMLFSGFSKKPKQPNNNVNMFDNERVKAFTSSLQDGPLGGIDKGEDNNG